MRVLALPATCAQPIDRAANSGETALLRKLGCEPDLVLSHDRRLNALAIVDVANVTKLEHVESFILGVLVVTDDEYRRRRNIESGETHRQAHDREVEELHRRATREPFLGHTAKYLEQTAAQFLADVTIAMRDVGVEQKFFQSAEQNLESLLRAGRRTDTAFQEALQPILPQALAVYRALRACGYSHTDLDIFPDRQID